MADENTQTILGATADMLDAASRIVRSAGESATPHSTLTGSTATLAVAPSGDLNRSDSPAWLDHHHPDHSDGVKQLGLQYHAVHLAAEPDPADPPKLRWQPARGATWKDFARIGHTLFADNQVFDGATEKAQAFPLLRLLQDMLHHYDVNDPDKITPGAFPWPTVAGFPTRDPAWTVRKSISFYLEQFNKNATGNPANRAADFPHSAGGPLLLTHGQCVELRHLFVTQEDLRLVAPFDLLNNLAW